MIVWLASYPKSGNTYLRALLSGYLFSKDGNFDFTLLRNISQFPDKVFFKDLNINLNNNSEVAKNYINAQNNLNKGHKTIQFFKTHSAFCKIDGHNFTDLQNTLGVIYIVRDPRNVVTSLTHHYSLNYNKAFEHMINIDSSLLEKSHELDHSNFTYLNSWSNHYKSWKNNTMFEILFIKYEDLQKEKEDTFKKILLYINKLKKQDLKIDENKFMNSIRSTNFSNLKNKELNEGFDEKVSSKKTGKVINFFNLGFNNRWQKLLPSGIKEKLIKKFEKELKELNYFYE